MMNSLFRLLKAAAAVIIFLSVILFPLSTAAHENSAFQKLGLSSRFETSGAFENRISAGNGLFDFSLFHEYRFPMRVSLVNVPGSPNFSPSAVFQADALNPVLSSTWFILGGMEYSGGYKEITGPFNYSLSSVVFSERPQIKPSRGKSPPFSGAVLILPRHIGGSLLLSAFTAGNNGLLSGGVSAAVCPYRTNLFNLDVKGFVSLSETAVESEEGWYYDIPVFLGSGVFHGAVSLAPEIRFSQKNSVSADVFTALSLAGIDSPGLYVRALLNQTHPFFEWRLLYRAASPRFLTSEGEYPGEDMKVSGRVLLFPEGVLSMTGSAEFTLFRAHPLPFPWRDTREDYALALSLNLPGFSSVFRPSAVSIWHREGRKEVSLKGEIESELNGTAGDRQKVEFSLSLVGSVLAAPDGKLEWKVRPGAEILFIQDNSEVKASGNCGFTFREGKTVLAFSVRADLITGEYSLFLKAENRKDLILPVEIEKLPEYLTLTLGWKTEIRSASF